MKKPKPCQMPIPPVGGAPGSAPGQPEPTRSQEQEPSIPCEPLQCAECLKNLNQAPAFSVQGRVLCYGCAKQTLRACSKANNIADAKYRAECAVSVKIPPKPVLIPVNSVESYLLKRNLPDPAPLPHGYKNIVFKRDQYTCQMCGANDEPINLVVHLVVPRLKGGRDLLTNFVTTCKICGSLKATSHGKYGALSAGDKAFIDFCHKSWPQGLMRQCILSGTAFDSESQDPLSLLINDTVYSPIPYRDVIDPRSTGISSLRYYASHDGRYMMHYSGGCIVFSDDLYGPFRQQDGTFVLSL